MRILLVDDEANLRRGLASFFTLRDVETAEAGDYDEALAAFSPSAFDAALLDLKLGNEPSKNGLALLARLLELDPALPCVMMSAHADIETALEAVRMGAVDFMEKPMDRGRLEAVLSSARGRSALRRELRGLEDAWLDEHIAGRESPSMIKAIDLARRAASSSLSILLRGPSGSGKEVLARFIHVRSPRADKPLVVVNCAAIPADLFESELFGYRKGAFTGAAADRDGLFHAADGGTLFLDEIGELPKPLQPKLLRALEYGEVRRVGAAEPDKVDARIVAATNRDLEALSASGDFREDLLFRLAQVSITVPGLEERREDIPALASWFLARAPRPGFPSRRFSPEALASLADRPWRGNVRELKNAVERAAFLLDSPVIGTEDLAVLEADEGGLPREQPAGGPTGGIPPSPGFPAGEGGLELGAFPPLSLKEAREEFDRRFVSACLSRQGGSVAATAKALGILPNNLSRLITSLGLKRR